MSLNFKAAWGIELGNSSVSAVKIQRTKDGPVITDHYVVPFDSAVENDDEFHDKAVQGLMRLSVEANIKKNDPVITGVPGRSVFARAVELPPMDPKRIPELIKYEASQQIPFPIEDVVWDYHISEGGGDALEEVHATIFAVRREEIDDLISIFNESGMKLQGIQTTPLALLNFVRADRDPQQPCVLIDVKASNIDFIILNGDDFYQRNITRGGNDINKALMTKFKIPFAQAEELKRSMGSSQQAAKIMQVVQPVFKNMSNEIQRSIGHYKSQNEGVNLTQALLLGNTLRMTKLVEYFQANLRLKIGAVSKLSALAEGSDNIDAINKQLPSLAVPIGLALQGVGADSVPLNLLPQEVSDRRAKARKIPWFAAAALISLAAGGQYFMALQGSQDTFKGIANKPAGDMSRFNQIKADIEQSRAAIGPARNSLRQWLQLLRDPQTLYPRDAMALLLSELNTALKPSGNEDSQLVFIEKIVTANSPPPGDISPITAVEGLPELKPASSPQVVKVTLVGTFYTREGGESANRAHLLNRVVNPLNNRNKIFANWEPIQIEATQSDDGAPMQRFTVEGYFVPEIYRKIQEPAS